MERNRGSGCGVQAQKSMFSLRVFTIEKQPFQKECFSQEKQLGENMFKEPPSLPINCPVWRETKPAVAQE